MRTHSDEVGQVGFYFNINCYQLFTILLWNIGQKHTKNATEFGSFNKKNKGKPPIHHKHCQRICKYTHAEQSIDNSTKNKYFFLIIQHFCMQWIWTIGRSDCTDNNTNTKLLIYAYKLASTGCFMPKLEYWLTNPWSKPKKYSGNVKAI